MLPGVNIGNVLMLLTDYFQSYENGLCLHAPGGQYRKCTYVIN